MATEEITLATGQKVLTLKELLRPGLKVVFVGLNPSPVSVRIGHYWQGRHGVRRWALLRKFEITPPLPRGTEDDAAFDLGYGFCDLIRRPTPSSEDLGGEELRAAPADLLLRLNVIGDNPLIVFIYAKACRCAEHLLLESGYRVNQLPGPYATTSKVQQMMVQLRDFLSMEMPRYR